MLKMDVVVGERELSVGRVGVVLKPGGDVGRSSELTTRLADLTPVCKFEPPRGGRK